MANRHQFCDFDVCRDHTLSGAHTTMHKYTVLSRQVPWRRVHGLSQQTEETPWCPRTNSCPVPPPPVTTQDIIVNHWCVMAITWLCVMCDKASERLCIKGAESLASLVNAPRHHQWLQRFLPGVVPLHGFPLTKPWLMSPKAYPRDDICTNGLTLGWGRYNTHPCMLPRGIKGDQKGHYGIAYSVW
jgi:hypothetical protein